MSNEKTRPQAAIGPTNLDNQNSLDNDELQKKLAYSQREALISGRSVSDWQEAYRKLLHENQLLRAKIQELEGRIGNALL